MRRPVSVRQLAVWLGVLLLAGARLMAAEHRGQVLYGGLPVPGATVTAARAGVTKRAITDADGVYRFPDLADGPWTVRVEMLLFVPVEKRVDVSSAPAGPLQWDLDTLPAPQLAAQAARVTTAQAEPKLATKPAIRPATPAEPERRDEPPSDELQQRAADGFLINGTVNNAAASPFAQFAAFGNNRNGRSALYNGNLGVTFDNSSLDARAYSLTGQDTPKPAYNRVQGLFAFGGPLRIPGLLKRNEPNFTVNYQWTRNRNATTQAGLMPTAAERNGDLSFSPSPILDPLTGLPFSGNIVPQSRISPQARALVSLYPLPNLPGNLLYNYQVPLVNNLHEDDLQARGNKQIGQKDFVALSFAGQSIRTDATNLFGFLDTGRTSGINASAQWRRTLARHLYGTLEYRFSRFINRVAPYFANRANISGEAGITGNNQDPVNWGPSSLIFSSGIASLSDAQASLVRNQTGSISYGAYWNRGRHNLQFGGGYGRQQFNQLGQQDPRGAFTFTGAAAGSAFAGFLLGVPDASSIAFGNADKYLRAHSSNLFVVDDWRQSPGFTLNLGLRWEYWSPVGEKYGRLVNLDVSPGFGAVAPHVGAALLHPDRSGFAPRLAFTWRPFSASSTVVRGGYGIYYDTNVYQPIALAMAQQAPLSKSLRVQNSPASPLTLADGFDSYGATVPTTFGVDPHFRVGYSQAWQLSVQRDLPGALQMVATYLGTKGTHAEQAFLPNTVPPGAMSLCACPTGFTYLTSGGNSSREAGQFQLRRRLRSGFAAQLQYTFAKAIDDATLGGGAPGNILVAQDWRNLRAERALSNFDQRHLVSLQAQYTSGMGVHGGTLLGGWTGRLLKDWTVATQITAGTGLPLTPILLSLVPGTGVANSLRPDYTGAPLYDAPPGLFLNRAAFVAPPPGHWGNAGRNSITGPPQFNMTASAGRTFRSSDRISYDLRIDATNPLNHVTYPAWNTIVSSAQFGLPVIANPMRSLQTTFRMRF